MDNITDEELFCDVCGLTYKEFLETGEVRCPNCLNVFKPHVVKLLKEKIEEDINNKKVVMTKNVQTKVENSKETIKEKIIELEKLLVICKKLNENDKAEIIEQEIKRQKELLEFEK